MRRRALLTALLLVAARSLMKEVVTAIRKRKGLKDQMPTPSDYLG